MTSDNIQYTFSGRVFPERACVEISEIQLIIQSSDEANGGTLRFWIKFSQVTAIFQNVRPVSNILSLKNYIEDGIRTALDALGFVKACGYDLEITSMVDSLGNPPFVFGVNIPCIQGFAEGAGIEFSDVINSFFDENGKYLQRSLADLREAIRAPKDTGFFCYRAVESLRQYFQHVELATNDNSSWEMLRTKLDVAKEDLMRLKSFADPVRHGDSIGISDEDRAEVFKITWDTVCRFVLFAKNGYQ